MTLHCVRYSNAHMIMKYIYCMYLCACTRAYIPSLSLLDVCGLDEGPSFQLVSEWKYKFLVFGQHNVRAFASHPRTSGQVDGSVAYNLSYCRLG